MRTLPASGLDGGFVVTLEVEGLADAKVSEIAGLTVAGVGGTRADGLVPDEETLGFDGAGGDCWRSESDLLARLNRGS